jgi:hypothetical protein
MRLWQRYRLEIIAVGIIGLGAVLLVAPRDAPGAPAEVVAALRAWVDALARDLRGRLLEERGRGELLGLGMVVAAGVFVAWRARRHVLHARRFAAHACPRCGGRLARVHRTIGDRVLGAVLVLPLHRYRCREAACGWSGLRLGGHKRRRRSTLVETDQG